jgi:DNA polymerase elongation subunit (family B)
MKAFLLEVEPSARRGQSGVRLFLKTPGGKSVAAFAPFEPYFYLVPNGDISQAAVQIMAVKALSRNEMIGVKRTEEIERNAFGNATKMLKVFTHAPGHVPALREECKAFGQSYEHTILFTRRFVIDSGLVPGALAEFELDEHKTVKSWKNLPPEEAFATMPPLRTLTFDIETHNPGGISRPEKDPILMVSYSADDGEGVITYAKSAVGKKFVKLVKGEKEMLEAFVALVKEKKADLICGYNSDEFDLPYMMERASKLRTDFNIGRGKKGRVTLKKLGLRRRARVAGRIHFDAFSPASFMDFTGTVKFPRLTLGAVYETLSGDKKIDTDKTAIWKAWDAGGEALAHLFDYSLADSRACRKVMEFELPLEIAMGRVTRMTLFDVSRTTPGQMVESLLMRRAFERGEIVPNKPDYSTVQARLDDQIQGAYVKVPMPGVYENIAVFDFRSLYPSIITSHNIDPFTLNCSCCGDDAFVAPTGSKFCVKKKGIVPETLEKVLDERTSLKAKLKKLEKGSTEYKLTDAHQWALKILANSTYGYLVYSRSRYYSRECGEAITALARKYIQDTMADAEKAGFEVLYGDTDSCFLLLGSQKREDAEAFRHEVNKKLPGRMELELEDIYPRGIFVSKKQGEKGAKKKYALINAAGAIKIRGFELVRRDWSLVARNTQRKVLEILLKEGDLPKAKDLVRGVLEDLRGGKMPLKDLAITTQLRKSAGSYDIMSPELSAVQKAKAAGVRVEEHALIEYIITKQGKTISEKAQLLELAKDYDADYYVNNQLMPAVLKILGALGVDGEDIKTKSSQKSLGDW